MAKKKRSWLARMFSRQPARCGRPRVPGFRDLTIERLETRAMLSGAPAVSLTQLLALMTPDPHPSGDMPTSASQLVPLVNYNEGLVPPDIPGNSEIHEFVVGIEQVYSDIESNTAARPAYWGENLAGGGNQYRIHFDDNGMLVSSWTVDWGDGSAPQSIQPQPWIVHQYPTAGNYTIQVTANSPDGTYSTTSSGIDITDLAGIGGSGSGGLQVTLSDVPPTLHVAGPQTVAVGAAFALDNLVSVSSPDAADMTNGVTNDYDYYVDWGDGSLPFTGNNIDVISAGGNGAPFLGALTSDTGDPGAPGLTHAFAAPGTYNLGVTVTNIASGLSDTQIIPITVVVLAPTIGGLPTDNTCNEGDAVNLSASSTVDPSLTDPVAYNWQITDSEGNVVAQSTDPNLSYNFTYADTYTVSLVASVDNVQSPVATATITVNNVAPSFVASIPDASVGVGQAYNLSAAFTDPNPNDSHTVTVNWDLVNNTVPLDYGAQVTEETTTPGSPGFVPGTIADSFAYSTAGTYVVEVTLTDSEGLSTTTCFNLTVVAASVALNSFAPSSDGSQLQVSYTITGGTAAPFTIGIYASSDGTTPNPGAPGLTSVAVDGTTFPLTEGTYTASFTPQFDDIQANYHLIAVADANSDSTANTVEFSGGIFVAQSLTASPPQNILYVFGTTTGDGDTVDIHGNADSPANTVVFNGGTPFDIGSTITGIHVRGEDGDDTFEADADVALPLWLFGGSGNSTLIGGAGENLIVGGAGTNVIHSSNGINTPETVDDSDGPAAGLDDYFQSTGTWTSGTLAAAFNGEELYHVASTGTDAADWTFANLDPTAYYDVYVAWTPIAGASTAAQYSVYDGTTSGTAMQPIDQSSIATVNQSLPPFDYQTAGTYWHDLGVFQAASGTLIVQLGTDSTGYALADAAMIVPETTPPLTNVTLNGFGVDSNGNLSVTYTINGEDAPPFSIGIYQSANSTQPGTLAGTIDVSDPSDLTGGGTTHTVIYQDSLNGLDGGQYYLAQLDSYDEVQETTKADNTSAPLTGVYQDADGDLYVLAANDTAGHSVSITQDPSTGNISVTVDSGSAQTFEDVDQIYVVTYHGDNTINAAGVDVPMEIYGGDGSDTIVGGDGGNTIYGGTAGGNTITAGAGGDTIYGNGSTSNTIYGGAGTDTLYAGDGGDTITGGTGNGEIYGGAGNDTLIAGQGNFWIQAGSGNATIIGGPGQDWLTGGSGSDFIYGGAGTEKIFGGAGTDHLVGGTGLDDITGGTGTNFIYGNGVHDLLEGGPGSNYIQPNYAYPSVDLGSVEVQNSSGTPTFDGNIDASGSAYSGDYQEIDGLLPVSDPGYGGEIDPIYEQAEWNFTDVDSGVRLGEDTSTPTAVYVTWQPNATPNSGYHWSDNVAYEVLDNGVPLANDDGDYTTTADQQDSPPSDSPLGGDRPWLFLGVWNVPAGDTLTVVVFNLDSSSHTALNVSDAMIHAIWPTVSLRPTDVTINSAVPAARDGDYIDWYDAVNPVQSPVEGQGNRVELQLNASIETLYYQIPGSTASDWQALLPNVAGLDFWNSATATTQLSDVSGDDLIDGSLTSSGEYTGDVWASTDPNGPLASDSSNGSFVPITMPDIADDVEGADDGLIPCQVPAQVAPTLGITANAVTSGTVTQQDKMITNPFAGPAFPVGPFQMGAARWQALNLTLYIPALPKGVKSAAPTPKQLIQVGTQPNDPNHTFSGGQADYLGNYQPYYFTYDDPGLGKMFWVPAPYALTFTLPPNTKANQYAFTTTETKTLYSGDQYATYDPKNMTGWTLVSTVQTPKSQNLNNQKPLDPTQANFQKPDSGLSWGLVTPPGGGAPVVQVVLTDTPQIAGAWDDSVREDVTFTITATDGAGGSQTWTFTFELIRLKGLTPKFIGTLK